MRSYDPEVFKKATENYRDGVPEDFDFKGWLGNRRNVMYDVDGNVGLATAETIEGLYNAHWFFKVRGKEALELAFRMYDDLFMNIGAKAVRGITPLKLRGARYLAKRIGFISLGTVETSDGPQEIMYLTKEDFLIKQEERYGS